jgi:hypothetical protein
VSQSLEVGTVVKITQILKPVIHEVLKLSEGMEGIVQYHNRIFEIDEGSLSEQKGPDNQDMFDFVMPGSNIRVGPICKMPDDHKVVCWVVKNQLWNVTNLNILFNNSFKWYIKRTGEVLNLSGSLKIN